MAKVNEADREISFCEGNLFLVSVALSKGRVTDAWSTGKMIHDMNYLLGAEFSDAESFFVRRQDGLCNAGHALAATRALEQMLGIRLPEPARLVRNIAHAMQYLIDHLTHFYVFYATDWLSLGAALRASPEETAGLARQGHASFHYEVRDYRKARQRLAALASGEGGAFFSAQDGDQPGYPASPEASLLVLSHIHAALAIRAKLTRARDILQGTATSGAPWQVGGLPADASPAAGGPPGLFPAARAECAATLRESRQFIEDAFWPDVRLVGGIYREWAGIGRSRAFLSWGEFPGPQGGGPLFPGGVFTLDAAVQDRPARPDQVSEERKPDWAIQDANRYRLRFGPGETAYHWPNDDFCWFGVPRHAGRICETGPVARIVAAHARGEAMVRPLVDEALAKLALPLPALGSTIGRVVARGLEAVACVRAAAAWLKELDQCLAGDDVVLRTPWKLPDSGEGIGLAELPRGALVHRIRLKDRRIVEHDSLVPSLWNFSPRDGGGTRGPLEQALLSTAVADPEHPVDLVRTIHAFDPCNACVLRIEDRDAGRVVSTKVK